MDIKKYLSKLQCKVHGVALCIVSALFLFPLGVIYGAETNTTLSPYYDKNANFGRVEKAVESKITVLEDEKFIELGVLPAESFNDELDSKSYLHKKDKVAVHRVLPSDFYNYWTLIKTKNDLYTWRVVIHSPGAYFIRPHIADAHLSEDKIRVFGKNKFQVTENNNPSQGEYWGGVVQGEYLFIEVTNRSGVKPRIRVDTISHGFIDPVSLKSKDGSYLFKEETCHSDVMCYSGWDSMRKGVARLYFEEGGFSYSCTGSLIMDLSNSFSNWLLTAHHCINSQSTASSLISFFNYTTDSCNGGVNDLWSYPYSTGATYKISKSFNGGSDFSLLELTGDVPPSASVAYLGWTTTPIEAGASVASIHHPGGSYKRISFGHEDSAFGTLQNFITVLWDEGTTEGGSSGSPLFSVDTKQVVGTLFGGYASCTSKLEDYYGEFYKSWSDGLSDYIGTGSQSRPSRPQPEATDGDHAGKVLINWGQVNGASSYILYRCSSTLVSTCTQIAVTNTENYSDSDVVIGTTYYYRLRACNGSGCSNYSNSDSGYASTVSIVDPDETKILIAYPEEGGVVQGARTITGYAIGPDGIDSLTLYVDGKFVSRVPLGANRPDVYAAFPSYPDSKESGFAYHYQFGALAQGSHRLEIFAYRGDENIGTSAVNFFVEKVSEKYLWGNQVSFGEAVAHISGDSLVIEGVSLGDKRADITVGWDRVQQGFATRSIKSSSKSHLLDDVSGVWLFNLVDDSGHCEKRIDRAIVIRASDGSYHFSSYRSSDIRLSGLNGSIKSDGRLSLYGFYQSDISGRYQRLKIDGLLDVSSSSGEGTFSDSNGCYGTWVSARQ